MLPSFRLSVRRSTHQKPFHLRFYASQGSSRKPATKTAPKLEESEDDEEVIPLPLLQRPLGVQQPPTTVPKTSKDQLNEMMDQGKRMHHRRHLYVPLHLRRYILSHLYARTRMKEASKGYFSDLNATRRHGGKTWIAPTVMIREDVRFRYAI